MAICVYSKCKIEIAILGNFCTFSQLNSNNMALMATPNTARYVVILLFLIFLAFLYMIQQHSFDPAQIITDIDDIESITIINPKQILKLQNSSLHNLKDQYLISQDMNASISMITNNNPVIHDVSSSNDHHITITLDVKYPNPPLYNSSNSIMDNPLQNPQCQDALINLHKINRTEFINTYYNDTLYFNCKRRRIWDKEGIWSREYLNAISTQNCFSPRLMLRTSLTERLSNTSSPVFYHIPKSASSSTATMIKEYFNFGSRWRTRWEMIHEPYNNTPCAFTFVRDPIKRFISGYYTVNAMIFGEMGLKFQDHNLSKWNGYKFIKVVGEPQRFETFIDEMRENPFKFYANVPLRHTASQTYFLSNFYGSPIHWIGRVENYKNHWLELLNYDKCGKWFKDKNHWLKKNINPEKIIKGMVHYGWDVPFYSRRQKRIEYGEYIKSMSLDLMLDNGWKLQPVYRLMNKRIYDKIVEYFYQDFVCFGYQYDFNKFMIDVELKEGLT